MTAFRQLFDSTASGYTYLLADLGAREAIAIDCVPVQTPTILAWLDELGLVLRYAMNTHVHADLGDEAAELRARTGARAVCSADASRAEAATISLP